MPRVIAGSAGGRRLKVLPGDHTRPTADRVKEALFSSLGDLTDLVVLDLFAGGGGLGIEALSRGAAAVFVEQDRRATAVIRDNLKSAGVEDAATVVQSTVRDFCNHPVAGPFDVVLIDPPYVMGLDDIAADVSQLASLDALASGARLVIERDRRRSEPLPAFLSHERDRAYGDTLLRYFTYQAKPATGAGYAAEGAPTP